MVLIWSRWMDLVVLLFSFGVVLYMIRRSLKGKPPKIRRLAALDAVDELVGRAAEMGGPILCTPGWGRSFTESASAPQFMAFLSLLNSVARKAYDAGANMIVSVAVPEMLPLSQEVLRENARLIGHPELYDESKVRYFPGAYGLIASTMGIFETKEKPASFIMVGPLFMETLYLSLLAATKGALQIGGTANISQIPFLVACCDYILIGEEIYAAGAYLDREPVQVGSIGGQDIIKLFAIGAAIAGFILYQFL